MAERIIEKEPITQPLRAILPIVGRRLRQDRVSLVFIATIILTTSALLAAVPLSLDQLTDDGLQAALDDAAPAERSVRITEYFDDPSGDGEEWLERRTESVVEALPSLFSTGSTTYDQMVTSDGLDAVPVGIDPTELVPVVMSLRAQPGVADHVEVIEGRLPRPNAETIDVSPDVIDAIPTAGVDPELDLTGRPILEVAFGAAPAEELELEVGDEVVLFPSIQLFTPPGPEDAPIVIRVVGILDLESIEDPYWFGDASLHDVGVLQQGLGFVLFATALAHPSEITRSMATLPDPLRNEVRVSKPTKTLATAGHQAIREAVRELDDTYQATPVPGGDAAASTGLNRLVDIQLSQRSVAVTIMSVAGLAVLVITAAAVLVVSSFLARRRRREVALLRGRGITPGQLLALSAIEAISIVIPAAILGWVAAVVLVEGEGASVSLMISAVVASIAVLGMVGATLPDAARDLNGLITEREERVATSKLRLVGEIVVLALAGLGIVGITVRASTITTGGIDPIILGVPVLVALAGGVVVLRLYRYPLGWITKIVGRLRGLVVVTALRRVEREPNATALPLLLLALGVGTTVFAALVVTSIEAGQSASAWQEVGADAHVISSDDGVLPEDTLSLPAGQIAAATRDVLFADGAGINTATVPGLLVDAADYQEVLTGTPISPLPSSLTAEPTDDVIPVIASDDEFAGRRLALGDRLNLRFGSARVEVEVVAIADTFPTMPRDGSWLVASRQHITSQADIELPFNELFISDPGPRLAEVTPEEVQIVSQEAVETSYRIAPLARGTTRAFSVAAGYSALLVGLAIGAALVMTARTRSRDLGYLRTLGMSSGQLTGGVAVELTIPTLLGVVLGILTGIGVAGFTAPSLDLSAFYANTMPSLFTIDPVIVALVGVVALFLVGVAAVVVAMIVRRDAVLDALRVGDA